jgi:hypothetical protein
MPGSVASGTLCRKLNSNVEYNVIYTVLGPACNIRNQVGHCCLLVTFCSIV